MLVRMEGDCTVARAEELRDTLAGSLGSGAGLELELGGVSAVDLSFCQLIHSLKRSCAEKGVTLAVTETLPEEHSTIAILCGLPELALGQADAGQGQEEHR